MENIYTFTVTDSNDFNVTIVGGAPLGGMLIDNGDGIYIFIWTPQEAPIRPLSFLAQDEQGAAAVHSPILYVCTCFNGGTCTSEGLLNTNELIRNLNCICTEG